jgi:hypothetical protein
MVPVLAGNHYQCMYVENVHETDPFLKSLRSVSSSDQQKMKGMRSIVVDMRKVIEEMKVAGMEKCQ